MNITTLTFKQVLQEFYSQDKYEFMLLFVSSYDGKDKDILEEIVRNAKIIDQTTGKKISFYYFINKENAIMDEMPFRPVLDIMGFGRQPLYEQGIEATMDTALEICDHFRILRTKLPAFILVDKNINGEPQIFSIEKYDDIESFLNPLNFIHSYIKDREDLTKNPQVTDTDIESFEESSIKRLGTLLNSNDGEAIIRNLQNEQGYSDAVLKIWDLVRTRGVRISRVVENIRREIYERGFDVFISCKSEDYAKAYCVYEYLKENGHNPFLAYHTLKEIGFDQYTAVLGEVINVCQNMVVFTTNVDYLNTPYVHAEWITFVNDINTGHKPNALLVNLLSPDIDIHTLPVWLRDKQCFTTENYREGLLDYLNNRNNLIIRELKETIEDTYRNIRDGICRWKSARNRNLIDKYLHKIECDKNCMFNMLEAYKHDLDFLRRIQEQVERELRRWMDEYYALEEKCSGIIEIISHNKISEHSSRISSTKKRNMSNSEFFQDGNSVKPAVSFFPKSPSFFDERLSGVPAAGITLSFFGLFYRKTYSVCSSIFAPAEVKRNSHMLVQVYLHLEKESEKVIGLAKESQKDAERRDYIPLQCKLRKGDKVDVLLNVYGESLLMSDKKTMVWQGSFTKCTFDYFIPNNIEVDQLSCKAFLSVNGVPVGEMNFITEIVVDTPRNLNTEINAHNYRKVFISYAHKDEPNVKFLAKGLELSGIDYFFDRKYLKAGDVYPQVIKDYINSADLFVLCWSANASQSEYVKKEYTQALGRVNPQVKFQKDANLSIYPISIEPRAELPDAMKDNYHFGEV